MKSITIALPNRLLERRNFTPDDTRTLLENITEYYRDYVRNRKPIELYAGMTTKVTLRADEEIINNIKEYASELNITILMFTSCLTNMLYKL